jgi:L-methionine (R)-S-oxide reductase
VDALDVGAEQAVRKAHYEALFERIEALLDGEDDWVAAMATVVCELHHGFEYYDWTGFYRVVAPEMLAIGPYQGGHGCLRIPFSRGVCGLAARTKTTQRIDDVHGFADHIACSATTCSEIVVPVINADGEVIAVLDVDSDTPAAFDEVDQVFLEQLARRLGERYGRSNEPHEQ